MHIFRVALDLPYVKCLLELVQQFHNQFVLQKKANPHQFLPI